MAFKDFLLDMVFVLHVLELFSTWRIKKNNDLDTPLIWNMYGCSVRVNKFTI